MSFYCYKHKCDYLPNLESLTNILDPKFNVDHFSKNRISYIDHTVTLLNLIRKNGCN